MPHIVKDPKPRHSHEEDGDAEKSPSERLRTVAVVEDEPRLRRSLVTCLENGGVACIAAVGTAEEALMVLPEHKPDVVLMDINLPGMDGVECVRRLTEKLPGVQVIMLTVHKDLDAIFNSLAAGASGYLLKPPRPKELLAAVKDITTGGAPMTSFIARKVVESFQKTPPAARSPDNLSPREVEVLELLARGLSYKEIAAEISITYTTVHTHIRRIYEKLHVQSRALAVAKYLGTSRLPTH